MNTLADQDTHRGGPNVTEPAPQAPTWLAAVLLLLSGAASLIYQVAWVRLLGLSMGSTGASISTVLAAFFLGLAGGSALVGRVTRGRNPLHVYLLLEGVIGVSGLALLPILLGLDRIVATVPALGSLLGFKFALAMTVLCIPTMCMGATFPVMAAVLTQRDDRVGLRLSQLYAFSTAGAVLGAGLSGFVLIPRIGLDGAVYIAVALNSLIVIVGSIALRGTRSNAPGAGTVADDSDVGPVLAGSSSLTGDRVRALAMLFGTGLVSIAVEVGWSKVLSILTGTTVYGFAAILTLFLTGITLGSWAVRHRLASLASPVVALALGLLTLAVSLLITRAALGWVPVAFEAINARDAQAWVEQAYKYGVVAVLVLPATFLLGALFPLNLMLACGLRPGATTTGGGAAKHSAPTDPNAVGLAYSINTLGGIVGSLLAGFLIIPRFGTDTLLLWMATLAALLPLGLLASLGTQPRRAAMAAAVAACVVAGWVAPPLDLRTLIASVGYRYDSDAKAGRKPDFLYLGEGHTGLISAVTYDNGHHVKIQSNGLNESWIDTRDPDNTLTVETLLGLVPTLLAENPRSAFVVGFGGGITARAITLTEIPQIDIVELEPRVIDAVRAVKNSPITILDDPRVRLTINDARNTLLLSPMRYDVIVSQPSHPWLAGSANVFSQEFFSLARSRLTDGGVFGSWIALFRMDRDTLRSILAAFYGAFEHGVVLSNTSSGDLLMFGSRKPIQWSRDEMARRMEVPAVRRALRYRDITEPDHLLWYYAMSREEALAAAGDAPPQSDTNIISEVRLSAINRSPKGEQSPYRLLREHRSLDIRPVLPTGLSPAEVVERVDALGRYFIEYQGFKEADLVVEQLRSLDRTRADSLAIDVEEARVKKRKKKRRRQKKRDQKADQKVEKRRDGDAQPRESSMR